MMDESSLLRVGILGAAGYTGRELVGLISRHPRVQLTFATSESEGGSPLRRLSRNAPDISLTRAGEVELGSVDVVFSCLPHGASLEWVERIQAAGAAAIDLSADLRVPGEMTPAWAVDAGYGLPELHRERIRGSRLIANPGCYPTAAILALAPLVRRGLVGDGPVIVNAASGVTGAGRTPKREYLFAEVADDYRAYAVGNVHRHLAEIQHQVSLLSDDPPELVFAPHLLPVPRGILETIYVPLTEPLNARQAFGIFQEDYEAEPFVEVMAEGIPSLAAVVGTNLVQIAAVPVTGVTDPMLMVMAAEDNLVKGAAGQAIQNLNVMMGWPETEGLDR